jgi:hypothetical protein
MLFVLAIFVGRLADPVALVVGAIIGTTSRAWWHVICAAIVAGVLSEIALASLQGSHIEAPIFFVLEMLVFGVWASAAFMLCRLQRGRRSKRRAEANQKQEPFHRGAGVNDPDALMEICTNKIAASWLCYNKTLKFKPEVTWAEIVEGFAFPMVGFVENKYPSLYAAGPHLFLHMFYRGLHRAQFPSPDEIDAAIVQADKRLTKKLCVP